MDIDRRLEEIKKNRQCKRLPVTASKEEIRNAHLVKMQAKKIMRAHWHAELAGPAFCKANLSVNHPDYGMTTAEHRAEKDNRQHIL